MKIKLTNFNRMFMAAVLGLSALSAHAVTLTPDADTPLPGTTLAAESQLAGTVLVDEEIFFNFTSELETAIHGKVQQRVLRAVDNTIDFYWRVFNDSNSASAIGSFRLGNFIAPEYNANWRIDGDGEKAPDNAHLFPNPPDDGFVNFNFNLFSTRLEDGLLPSQSSKFFFLDTAATNYAKTAYFDLTPMTHEISSAPFDAYAPVAPIAAPIPEPETYAMLLAGLGLLGFMARRRKDLDV